MVWNDAVKSKSLRLSLYKGIFGCVTTGLTQEYFTPFLLFLGGGARHVGILNAAMNLFSSLSQLFSAEIVEKLRSRRRMIGLCIIIQVLALAAIMWLSFTHKINQGLFIVLAVLFVSSGTAFHPAWLSFLSDLVEVRKRGDYFGWRSRNLGLITVAAMIFAGLVLHKTENINTLYGFCLLFGLGFITRALSLVRPAWALASR
jgi:MFS family permease